MIQKIAIAIVIVVIFALMLWFTRINPGTLQIDLAFGTIEPSIAMAFAITFVFGWLFGLACTSLFIIRVVNERRRLRKALRIAESEVSSLRSLPIADAES
jgi:putative membrane protein